MNPVKEISLRLYQGSVARREGLVQDRPTLGTLPRAKRGRALWLLPAVDLACAVAALWIVVVASDATLFPALPLSPILLLLVNGAIGVYGDRPARAGLEDGAGAAWPVVRLLVAALFSWSTSLMTELSGPAQLSLFVLFVILEMSGRAFIAPILERVYQPERWVLIGDLETSERLRSYEPLRRFAQIVHAVHPDQVTVGSADRSTALEILERWHADRVVIGRQADDESLLSLVRAFRSLGVAVSLLPRPLDLLEAPGTTSSQVAGLPLIEVDALATRRSTPYLGPDRRRDRRAQVSVVIPAINEEKNIGRVLSQLPDDVHEVILVDGNSRDRTIEVAREVLPEIRVRVQAGRGKGDALRTGFAAVTGNLVVMLDADGSANPAEITRFVEALENGADFAKGSRFLEGGGSDDITPLRRLGNSFLSGATNLLHGTHFTDLCYGYNAFWTRCLPFISLDAPGFEVETLINLRVAGAGMRIAEVPSFEEGRISGHSNLKTFSDGFRVLGTIVSEARRRRAMDAEPFRRDSKPSEDAVESTTVA